MSTVVNQTLYIGQWIEGKDGKRYINFIPLGAPVGEAFDCTTEFGKDINEMARKQLEAQQQAAKEVSQSSQPAETVEAEIVSE